MQELPRLYNTIEGIKGTKLVVTLLVSMLVFLVIGLITGNFIRPKLNINEIATKVSNDVGNSAQQMVTYSGRIKFIDASIYPEDNISYVLVDPEGKELVLLSAKDQKLSVAEGLNAKVIGKLSTSVRGNKKILTVDEVIINNVAN